MVRPGSGIIHSRGHALEDSGPECSCCRVHSAVDMLFSCVVTLTFELSEQSVKIVPEWGLQRRLRG